MVVKAGGAAVLQQLPHAGEGTETHHLLVQALPDLIQGGEPVEQLQILYLGQVAGKNLIEMVMRVDEARIAQQMAAVQLRLGGMRQIRSQGPNPSVFAVKIHIPQHLIAVIAGDHRVQMADQQ